MTRQTLLWPRIVWGTIRQLAQVLVLRNRTDHFNDFRLWFLLLLSAGKKRADCENRPRVIGQINGPRGNTVSLKLVATARLHQCSCGNKYRGQKRENGDQQQSPRSERTFAWSTS